MARANSGMPEKSGAGPDGLRDFGGMDEIVPPEHTRCPLPRFKLAKVIHRCYKTSRSGRLVPSNRQGVAGMVAESAKYLGIGIYSVSDAAKLTGLSQAQVRHWINGYRYKVDGRTRKQDPVLNRQLAKLDDQTALGFLDLIEMRVIEALLEKKIQLATHSRCP